ncbi:DUF6113 family protein [Salinibacterium sp. SYSU T00001]|uniref:DUF6113 family protein n=1 Tax=Homoserinimonas sedimenticola TaxID=2986805 RepID=UPI0022366BAF|nr:DUF6113 family protein [Salinibacterium sedimenticola]MCW4386498.1 DUF6113 family protein [Salinibacterium sedimenticola]
MVPSAEHPSAGHSLAGVLERALFVHAHPDDETISTGGMLALLAERGADVTVLTCTRGEAGEVIPESLRHLEGDGPALAAHREGELRAALAALGVTSHLYLGEAGARAEGQAPRRYLDSGMVEGEDGRPRLGADVSAGALCRAPFEEVVADLVAAIVSTGARAVVSYDEQGGYGHPDHMLAHRASRAAAGIAGVPFHVIIEDEAVLARLDPADTPEGALLIDVSPALERKAAALRAHKTQVTLIERPGHPLAFALSNERERPVLQREGLYLLDRAEPDPSPDSGDPRPETLMSRIATILVSLLIGALVGVLLTINHQHRVAIADASVPVGLIGALLVVAALLVGMRLVFSSRLIAFATALGIVGASAILAQEGPGGSVLVPANLEGVLWAYGPLVIALLVLAWPRLPESRKGRMEVQPRQEGPSL